jgi:hypothetical protein
MVQLMKYIYKQAMNPSVKECRDFFKALLQAQLQRYKSASKTDLIAEINSIPEYKEAFETYIKDLHEKHPETTPEASPEATSEATKDAAPEAIQKKTRVCISRKKATNS